MQCIYGQSIILVFGCLISPFVKDWLPDVFPLVTAQSGTARAFRESHGGSTATTSFRCLVTFGLIDNVDTC